MRKKLKFLLIIFILITLLCAQASPLKELRIVTDRDYPPFTFIDENGKLVGISVDFWNLWSERMGIKVELIPLEWEKAQIEIREGKVDAIDTIFKIEEREKYLDFSYPIFPMTSSIYYSSNLKGISSLKDITPYIVGVKRGDALIKIALSKNKDINFKFYENYRDIVQAARKKEISVFLMDDIPANYYLVKNDLLYKFSKTRPFSSNYLYVAVPKGNSKILNLINQGISKIKKEEIEALIDKYILKREKLSEIVVKIITWVILGSLTLTSLLLVFNRILNMKLKQALQETFRLWRYFEGIFEISTLRMKEEDFFQKALELSFHLLTKAKAGSIFRVEEGGVRLVKVLGHDKELKGLLFRREDYISSENGAIIIKDLLTQKRSSKELFENLKKYSIPIKESLITPIRWQDKVIGYLCLDIPLGSKESFNSTDMQIIHQFGKSISAFYVINVPQDILNKNGKFTKEEYEFVKIHSVKSEEILSQVEELKDIAKVVRHHHERWDGKGYPDGLSGEEIPLESRIICIADSFDAMTSERPYKRVFTLEEAKEELLRCKGPSLILIL